MAQTETEIGTYNINSNNAEEPGCISSNLPARAMRCGMENKGLLAEKGSMYVGTGESNTVTVTLQDNTTGTYTIPKTKALDPPTEKGDGIYVLKCVVSGGVVTMLDWVRES